MTNPSADTIPGRFEVRATASDHFSWLRTRLSVERTMMSWVRAALSVLPALCARWLPGGKRVGREYVALNPTRADRRAGSFKINLQTGRWADFATGDKGGDVVSLAACLSGKSQAEAARALADMLGLP